MTPTYLVTGANRGIGLEFARQLAQSGNRVIATARKPEEATELAALDVRVEELDISDSESVDRFAERLGDEQIDVLINNAGAISDNLAFEELDVDSLQETFGVNSLGAMRITQALLPNLMSGEEKKVVQVTSMMGSLTENNSGGAYAYRMSKAALNMFTRSLAVDLENEGFICAAIHPGWVQTRLGGSSAQTTPEESASSLLNIINELSSKDNGAFVDHENKPVAW